MMQSENKSSPRMLRNSTPSPEALAAIETMRNEQMEYQRALPGIREDGEASLRRLLPIAQGSSGQCRYVAAFLLGLYNGRRFPFDLTDLRGLDLVIHNDCLAVLRLDHMPINEVHAYFDEGHDEGHRIWEDLAARWGIKDHLAGTGEL